MQAFVPSKIFPITYTKYPITFIIWKRYTFFLFIDLYVCNLRILFLGYLKK